MIYDLQKREQVDRAPLKIWSQYCSNSMENMVKKYCPKSMEVMVKILSQINENIVKILSQKYGPNIVQNQ